MRTSDRFPSKYLAYTDFESQPLLTIKYVSDEVVGRNNTLKGVVYFREEKKGLILNKTISKTISGPYGDDEAEWPNGQVVGVVGQYYDQDEGCTKPCCRLQLPTTGPKRLEPEFARQPATAPATSPPAPSALPAAPDAPPMGPARGLPPTPPPVPPTAPPPQAPVQEDSAQPDPDGEAPF